jgi:hypothetical protein
MTFEEQLNQAVHAQAKAYLALVRVLVEKGVIDRQEFAELFRNTIDQTAGDMRGDYFNMLMGVLYAEISGKPMPWFNAADWLKKKS